MDCLKKHYDPARMKREAEEDKLAKEEAKAMAEAASVNSTMAVIGAIGAIGAIEALALTPTTRRRQLVDDKDDKDDYDERPPSPFVLSQDDFDELSEMYSWSETLSYEAPSENWRMPKHAVELSFENLPVILE